MNYRFWKALWIGCFPVVGCAFWLVCDNAEAATRGQQTQESTEQEQHSEQNSIQARRYEGFEAYHRLVTTRNGTEAQRWFDQGIQLMYGFNHDEAIRSFEKAAELDPDCAMAWWGSAYARGMHINNPEMGEEQSRLAYQASRRALEAIDDESELEKALIHAVAVRYAWPAPDDRSELDQAYADAMEQVWHRFPEDPDVGSLFAEALMDLQPWDLWDSSGAPKGRTFEILGVLEKVLNIEPLHPGANHFYIHAIEASPWPEKGVAAADRLTSLVPGSGHLTHMPSHIFIRVGRYAEAVECNQRAINADEKYFAIAPPPDFYSLYFMHNIHFLAYAAMMEGRFDVALQAARKIEQTIPPDFLKNYVTLADGFMPTTLHVLIRFGKWDQILDENEPESWRLLSRAEWHFARSVALSNLGKTSEAAAELNLLDSVAAELTDEWKMGNNPAANVVQIARTMAAGELAYKSGDAEQAFKLLREAVELEDHLVYDEPPGWMQPIRHALGALLLADGLADEAEEVYRADLHRHPNNAWSLLGLQQSMIQQGNRLQAEAMQTQVDRAWSRADVKPVASCYCHPDVK
jgi:tetratricopeptide (TPR) repeat protein